MSIFFLAAGCGGEPGARPGDGPEHPDGGTPPFGDAGTDDPLVQEAYETFGDSFELNVRTVKDGRAGCGVIRVQDVVFESQGDERSVSLFAEGRWAAYPPSFPKSGEGLADVAYRSGDFPISWFTEEYPEYGTFVLRYQITGTFDLVDEVLRITLRNFDKVSEEAGEIFLAASYENWTDEMGETVACLADDLFTNEFFVAVPSGETTIPIGGMGGLLCMPCGPPVEEVRLEIR